MDRADARMDRMEARLDRMESRLDRLFLAVLSIGTALIGGLTAALVKFRLPVGAEKWNKLGR